MKSLSTRLLASLATLGLGLAPAACGEKPSFKEQETVNRRTATDGVSDSPSADAQAPHAPKGVIGEGSPDGTDASGAGTDGAGDGARTERGASR